MTMLSVRAEPTSQFRQPSNNDGPVRHGRTLRSLLIFIVLNGVVLNLAFFAVNLYLVRVNLGLKSHGTFGPLKSFATATMGTDSNAVMLSALHIFQQNPTTSLYGMIFFQEHQKFQYPLASLLPYYALQAAGAGDRTLIQVSTVISWLSACGVIILTAMIALRRFPASRGLKHTATIELTVLIAGLLFYPLTHSYSLGQIQTVLTFGFAIAFYCWILDREKTAGALMGLMTLVKPQYGLFLIWAMLRKKWGAFAAGSACLAAGLLSACLVFGAHNNLDYLKVVRTISQHGEGFAANQSVNGLMNRLLFNGNNLIWDAARYAPYNSIVYFGTLVSSLTLVVLALFYPWKARKAGAADFACCVLVSTMASPIAWEHHYAIILPVFAWLWFGDYTGGSANKSALPIALAYILISNDILPVSAVAQVPALNILQSYLYLGAIIVLALLLQSCNDRSMSIQLHTASGGFGPDLEKA
jgi:hypothetical protein